MVLLTSMAREKKKIIYVTTYSAALNAELRYNLPSAFWDILEQVNKMLHPTACTHIWLSISGV